MIIRKGKRTKFGQALIEIIFVVLLFMFIGMMVYETGILYYNVNMVSNSLKQAVWLASLGATDEEIINVITAVDEHLLKSVFMEHQVSDFALEVWAKTPGGEYDIAPLVSDDQFSPGTYNASTRRRAAYIWRAQGLNVRLSLNYKIGYVSPYFGATPVILVTMPLSASQAVMVRNDEDHDGLVDLYEPELFLPREGTYTALCHTDSGGVSDKLAYDIDNDAVPDTDESGFSMYDYDNDYTLDIYDAGSGQNMIRHPNLGGNPISL